MNFGHVVWGGNILGKPAILAGNRGGDKDLVLVFPNLGGSLKIDTIVIDKDIGPTQIVVISECHRDLIFSSNREVGEVVLYEISQG